MLTLEELTLEEVDILKTAIEIYWRFRYEDVPKLPPPSSFATDLRIMLALNSLKQKIIEAEEGKRTPPH